jgi:L-2-hydroxyglutarate oxidase
VRVQALLLLGGLVNDFLFVEAPNAVHVCNAPSSAATACLQIGRAVAEKVPVLMRGAGQGSSSGRSTRSR